jgi:hypothetical protein
MSTILPDVNFNVLDGGLDLAPNLSGGVAGVIGQSSIGDVLPHVVTSAGQIAALFGTGALARVLRDALEAGAQALVACRVSSIGGVPGAAAAPVRTRSAIGIGGFTPGETNTSPVPIIMSANCNLPGLLEFKVTTGGSASEGEVSWRFAGGAWHAPMPMGDAVFDFAGGSSVVVMFVDGTYVIDDTWSVLAVEGGTGTLTASGAPAADAVIDVEILTGGGRNGGTYRLTVDGVVVTAAATIPVNGQVVVQGLCTLLFTEGEAEPHFVDGDIWRVVCSGPVTGVEEIAAAALKIRAAGLPVECIYVAGATSPSTWAALDVLAETEFKAKGRFMFFMAEAADVADGQSEAAWVLARVAEPVIAGSLHRVAVCAGYVGEGEERRSSGGRVLGHVMGLAKVSFSPGRVRSGSIGGVTVFGPTDEGIIAQLDIAGFITLRRWEGLSGAYVTNGRMLVDETSDFRWLEYRRVMDRACRDARLAGLSSAHDEGDVTGLKALESDMQVPLDRLVGARLCAGATVVVPIDQDVVGTSTVAASVSIQPIPAMRWINVDIGFTRGDAA